ncbi:MAG TPA: MGMT family protein [Actinomycetota bacterium]|nr:MGMT family protein [Actinomycetota bacterium]
MLTIIRSIPRGTVLSYGEVADRAGLKSARIVGRILAENDIEGWHRVLRSDGSPAPHLAPRQTELLRAEGVTFKNGRVVGSRARRERSSRSP